MQAIVKPLSKEGTLPARQDLTTFWDQARRAIRGLGVDCVAEDMERDQLDVIAPVILGDSAYALLKNAMYTDWYSFT